MFKAVSHESKRMTRAEIDQLVRRADIAAILDSYNIEFSQTGDNFQLVCPFHDDHSPSLGIKAFGNNKGLWRCLSPGCEGNGGGNLFQFIMKLDNCKFGEALARVSKITKSEKLSADSIASRIRNFNERESERDKKIVPLPFCYLNPIKIAQYLQTKKRPFNGSMDIIRRYCMCIKKYRPYNGWLLIPIHDINKKQISYFLQDFTNYDRNKRYPLSSAHSTDLFNSWRFKDNEYIIITEGIWDAIKLEILGYPGTSCYSAAMTPAQRDLIYNNWKKVVLLMDSDIAGREGAIKIARMLMPIIEVEIINLSKEIGDPKYLTSETAKVFLDDNGFCKVQ